SYTAGNAPKDLLEVCQGLEPAIKARIDSSTADTRRHIALQSIAAYRLTEAISEVRSANSRLAKSAEPLIAEKLEVLQSASAFLSEISPTIQKLDCPACGQQIAASKFREHVVAEQRRLQELITLNEERKTALATLSDIVRSLQSDIENVALKEWKAALQKGALTKHVDYIETLSTRTLHESLDEPDLKKIEDNGVPIIKAAADDSAKAPPNAAELSADKQKLEAAKVIFQTKKLEGSVKRLGDLATYIGSLEGQIRSEIRDRSQIKIDELSDDIRTMWGILHPGSGIEDVCLSVPKGADKAIDVCLKFHGVEQNSPRLTLSEGFRNSLGLCIFLAMAKREAKNDRPVFLDDVVISFDRHHRGMIYQLLELEFHDRQVIILTHDRDWYADLMHQLDHKRWSFKQCLPWDTPLIGIRIANENNSFEEARALIKVRPASAANAARSVMDQQLAKVAEKMKIEMPFLRGERNDRRMAPEFLERIIADAETCFQEKSTNGYARNTQAIEILKSALGLLSTWANRGSHSPDVTDTEAAALIDASEKALSVFRCACKTNVWETESAAKNFVQCGCGGLRWRYGKA
ncbi:MAG: hypothetical protein ACRDHZ_10900, partial [Ktedonobacteraceae bacterium]